MLENFPNNFFHKHKEDEMQLNKNDCPEMWNILNWGE